MELTEKESHCIARLLQGAIFGESVLNGCTFCKFRCSTESDPAPHLDELRQKLWIETGVDLRFGSGKDKLPYSKFPYKRFLRASNEETIDYFRNFFVN